MYTFIGQYNTVLLYYINCYAGSKTPKAQDGSINFLKNSPRIIVINIFCIVLHCAFKDIYLRPGSGKPAWFLDVPETNITPQKFPGQLINDPSPQRNCLMHDQAGNG